ncbi:hypothetical protein B7494_g7922 [Chlorociboria aeruginascens]|nr:hypothetical protein B7494_g7922 [Chlorociboria aeruginascens]
MSANSNATTTANALNNQLTRNLQNYVQCLHVACLHEYTGTGEELGASQLIEKHEGYIFWVMHPRWCPACLESRKRQLERTFRDRLPKPDLESTEVRRERAYTIGVRNGRIRALSTSFEDCEKFGKKGLDGKSGEEELVERMERLGLASKQDGDEAVGELARLFEQAKVRS